jgi:hypothetical protein
MEARMPEQQDPWEQAKMAYRYYIKNDRTIAFQPGIGWVPVEATAPGDDRVPPQASPQPGLSARALERIAVIQDAQERGLLSHDKAEDEIITIIREES